MNEYHYLDKERKLVVTVMAGNITEADELVKTKKLNPMQLTTCIGGRLVMRDVNQSRTAVITQAHTYTIQVDGVKKPMRAECELQPYAAPVLVEGLFANSLSEALVKHARVIDRHRYDPNTSFFWVYGNGLHARVKNFK